MPLLRQFTTITPVFLSGSIFWYITCILENFWSTITIDIKKFNENVQKTVQEKTGLKLTSQTQVVEQPRREMLQEGIFQKIIIS